MFLYKETDMHAKEILNAAARQLAYYERFGNGGTRTYSALSQRIDIDERYQPGNPKIQSYCLPRVLLDNNGQFSVFSADPSKELLDLAVQGDQVWMCVFPQLFESKRESDLNDPYLNSVKENALERRDLQVISTSSCRTVLDIASKAMFKMHCPYLISRFDRRLGKGTIEHCVSVTKELKDLLGKGKYPKFAVLPDSIGVTFNGEKGWGYIVRESTPFPPAPDGSKSTMIPMFALYGSDVLDEEAPIVITQMIDKGYELSDKRIEKKDFAKRFTLDEIIFPLIEFFIVAFKEKGILLELHGQNTLIEVDAEGLPTRIVHRDLDDAIDLDVREKMGLVNDGLYEGQFIKRSDEDKDAGSEHSIVFDKSIGRMNLDKLAQAIETSYGIAKEELEAEAQAFFEKLFPEYREYFPKELHNVYNYSSEMKPGQYNYYNIIPIADDVARWRPAR